MWVNVQLNALPKISNFELNVTNKILINKLSSPRSTLQSSLPAKHQRDKFVI